MTQGWWVQEDSEEGFDLSRTRPKYSVLLEEEDYETDDDLVPGFDKGPEAKLRDARRLLRDLGPLGTVVFFLLK